MNKRITVTLTEDQAREIMYAFDHLITMPRNPSLEYVKRAEEINAFRTRLVKKIEYALAKS